MKITSSRVSFGHEKKLIQVEADRCVGCGVSVGKQHKFGCDSEECPQCRCMIIGCSCNILSSYESAHIIQALYERFSSLEDALDDIIASKSGSSSSYLDHAAMQYIFENVPKDVRGELIDEFRKKFPLLIPHLEDERGTPYYTAEQLSRTLNIPLPEVQEKIDAMLEAGTGIRFIKAADLKKTQ